MKLVETGDHVRLELQVNEGYLMPWILLSEVTYAASQIQLGALLANALAFYVSAFENVKEDPKWRKWDFLREAWEALTGFQSLYERYAQAAETLEESVVTLKVRQLALETYAPREHWAEPDVPFGISREGGSDPHRGFPSLDHSNLRKTLFLDSGVGELRDTYSSSLTRLFSGFKTVKVTFDKEVHEDFVCLCKKFRLSFLEGLYAVIRQIPIFIALDSNYTDSFREDLGLRYKGCRELRERVWKICDAAEVNAVRADYAGKTLAQRIPLGCLRVPGGVSLSEYLAREDDTLGGIKWHYVKKW